MHSRARLVFLFPILIAVALTSVGCATGYHRKQLVDRRVLQDLQNISLEALKPSPAPAKANGISGNPQTFDPKNGLTPEDAVLVAEYLNPSIRAFRSARGVAEGELVTARLLTNPEIQLNLLHIQNFTHSLGTAGLGAVINWSPPRPGERDARIRRAEARVEQVRAEVSAEEWNLGSEVRKAYFAALALERRRQFAEAALKLQQRVLQFYEDKFKLGDAPRIDLNLARLSYGDAVREQRLVINEAGRTLQELNRLLGLPPTYATVLRAPAEALDYKPVNTDLNSLEQLMLTEQPDLQAAKQEYEQAEQSARIARYQRWPWFRLGPALDRNDVEGNDLTNKVGLGFSLDLPILNFNQGEIRRSEADRDRLYAAYVARLHDRRADLNEAYRNVKAQEELIQIFQTTIRPALEENKQLTEAGFQLKELNLLQILTTQDRVLRSQSEFISSELQYWQSVFDLEKAVGAPISTGVKP